LERRYLGIDVFELRIAIGMRGAFLGLPIALETIRQFRQQFGHLLPSHLVPLPLQFRG
jgi:hypothetical protein